MPSHRSPGPWPLFLLVVALLQVSAATFIRKETTPFKGYSGIRFFPEAPRLIYYCGETIAVLEMGDNRELLNCELIEVRTNQEKKETLQNLTSITTPVPISFPDMMDLMQKCQSMPNPAIPQQENDVVQSRSATNILSGVFPGTKWCGLGDLAATYYDLGKDANIDKCCRSHDLCPVKIRGNTSRYNLTNNSVYTKSHCRCDNEFQKCLKAQGRPTADVVGNLYFNLIRVPCVDDDGRSLTFQRPNYYKWD